MRKGDLSSGKMICDCPSLLIGTLITPAPPHQQHVASVRDWAKQPRIQHAELERAHTLAQPLPSSARGGRELDPLRRRVSFRRCLSCQPKSAEPFRSHFSPRSNTSKSTSSRTHRGARSTRSWFLARRGHWQPSPQPQPLLTCRSRPHPFSRQLQRSHCSSPCSCVIHAGRLAIAVSSDESQ